MASDAIGRGLWRDDEIVVHTLKMVFPPTLGRRLDAGVQEANAVCLQHQPRRKEGAQIRRQETEPLHEEAHIDGLYG